MVLVVVGFERAHTIAVRLLHPFAIFVRKKGHFVSGCVQHEHRNESFIRTLG